MLFKYEKYAEYFGPAYQEREQNMSRPSTRMISRQGVLGYSIVELMVALTIGLIILTGVAAIFGGSRSTNQTNEGLARLQENARFAMDYMNREIRMAGYFGCLKDATKVYNNISSAGGFPNDFTKPIQGFEANGTGQGATYTITASNPNPVGVAITTWTPSIPTGATNGLDNKIVPGADVIIIRRAAENDTVRLVPPYNNSAQIFLDPNTAFNDGDTLIVTDCSKASVFIATNRNASGSNVAHAAGNTCSAWGNISTPAGCPPDPQQYRDGSELTKTVTTAFYIGRGTSGSPALFMTTTNGTNFRYLELAEGVENMQIQYGVDTTAPPAPLAFANRYMTADAVDALTIANPLTGWPRVMSVRINLLMRTTNISGQSDQVTNTATYVLGGTTIDPPNDKLLRRVFTSTIQLRNRLVGS